MAKPKSSTGAVRPRRPRRGPSAPAAPAAASVVPYEISDRVTRQALIARRVHPHGMPRMRRLRIYTLDPSISHRLGGIATVDVPYEVLQPGPLGAMFDVRPDGVPAPLTAAPLDLDAPALLLSDGVAPSPADGRFHLQMAYAVCSLTYTAFRRALGREIAWAIEPTGGPDQPIRLRVRPFGFEGRNAGFSREAGDLSFGWFRAGEDPAGFVVPEGLISTALSHDIIAHEVTHALLDGLRSAFALPTNVDVPAFHEGFADLVALFLHFSYPDVVAQAIRESRGRLGPGSMLAEIAREFGYARGEKGARRPLRTAIDVAAAEAFDSDVHPGEAGGPIAYDAAGTEPHVLGSVLVSAVFEAFTTIVRRKSERYYRMAGIDPGATERPPLNEALVTALAEEASTIAAQFLNLCIRAIDYCPPADMEMGEYLRALITADRDLESRDKWGYREALMRSFCRRRIFPNHCQFMTEDAVCWHEPGRDVRIPGLAFSRLRFNGDPASPASPAELLRQANALGRFVSAPARAAGFRLIAPGAPLPAHVTYASPPQVQSIRVSRRAAPDGRIVFDLVAEVTQSCTVRRRKDLFEMTGGCTLVIDPDGRLRYVVHKRLDHEERQVRHHEALTGPLQAFWARVDGRYVPRPDVFRRLHGHRD